MNRLVQTVVICASIPTAAALAADGTTDPLRGVPKEIPAVWLSRDQHPRWVCTPEELAATRRELVESPRIRAFVEGQRATASHFVKMSAEELIALAPRPKSQFVYGLGMNLDPVHKMRMIWAGWNKPFVMRDIKGREYPNADWPDDGSGVVDPKSGKRYYFVAQANAKITQALEQHVLPALADVYVLTGSQPHARAAAVLLDAIANVYPTNRRGPLDYPVAGVHRDRGGRLDRPYYQVARGLMNYVHAIDLLVASEELDKPSHFAKGQTIREHIIRNLLWDGGAYCLEYAREAHSLNNGQADYQRGAALVGLILGVRAFSEPMLSGPTNLYLMLANNIDQDGLYYETSPDYDTHTRDLYVDMAEEVEAMRRLGWPRIESVYARPAMRQFLTEPFNRQELSGHIPKFGDSGPDRGVFDPIRRLPSDCSRENDNILSDQIRAAWIQLVRMPGSDAAARLLRNSFGGAEVMPPSDAWSIYHIRPEAVAKVCRQPLDPSAFETRSVFYGGKGLALLRGGRGAARHGVQLFFGPEHNHGQLESLTWMFFARGAEWSFDPGYFNTHLRFGWTTQSVAHQSMVVDQKSVDPRQGSGTLLAWHDGADVQWAMAEHARAYHAQKVPCYERLIAQAQQTPGGQPAYWLDIGRVYGGKSRDDSFHTQMTRLDANVPLPPVDPKRPSLFGQKDWGRLLRADMRLENQDDKPFHWAPPGEGYGFLGNPREMPMPAAVRMTFSAPAVTEGLTCQIVADLLGAEGRRLIVSDGPQMLRGLPSLPYVLQRDCGPRASVFAKLIRLVDNVEADPVLTFEKIKNSLHAVADSGGPKPPVEPGVWCVTWKDGRRDLWIVGAVAGRWAVHTDDAKLPKLQTDARVALVRLDRAGKVIAADASEATFLKVGSGPSLQSPARLTGRICKIDPESSPVAFDVDWDADWRKIDVSKGPLALRSEPAAGQATTWSLRRAQSHRAAMDETTAVMGRCRFEPQPDKPGWYRLGINISRFLSLGGQTNTAFAVGRAVYDGNRYVGRVTAVGPGATSLAIKPDGAKLLKNKGFDGTILLAGPGDRLMVPLPLHWHVSP